MDITLHTDNFQQHNIQPTNKVTNNEVLTNGQVNK